MDLIDKFLKHETRKQRSYLWGSYIVFAPQLVKEIFGDGKQIIYFGTIDQRPRYWIVRIDSQTDIDNDFDWEEIFRSIRSEFGEWSDDDQMPYPAIKLTMGTHWGLLKNFGITESVGVV